MLKILGRMVDEAASLLVLGLILILSALPAVGFIWAAFVIATKITEAG